MPTKIEWAAETWNPVSGCTPVSEACDECYAKKFALRLQKNPKLDGKYADGFKPTVHYDELAHPKPAKWKSSKMIFVVSMGDLFHPAIPFEIVNAIFSIMADNSQHTYIILTKRPHGMIHFMNWKTETFGIPWVPSDNIWFGTTIEFQKYAKDRIFYLLRIPSLVHFISYEPALGPLNLLPWFSCPPLEGVGGGLPDARSKINWVICGGQTGHNSRPMHPDWVRSMRDQCQAANVPFFFKSWGDWGISGCPPLEGAGGGRSHCYRFSDGTVMIKAGKKNTGRLLDGKEHSAFPII